MSAGNDADRIIIRTIRADEAEALRELRLEALRVCPAAFSADLVENESRPIGWWQEQVARNTGDGEQAIFVAADGDRLLAMTGIWGTSAPKQAHRGSVWGVYVRPEARRCGLAARLVNAAVDWAAAKGKVIVELAVIVGNHTARRCYERAGFTVYAIQPMVVRVEGVFYDEWLMVKRL